jgi:CRISPR-associated protein Csb1
MTTQHDGILELVRKALAEGVAIRAVNKLLPAEGEGGKVMPPTFSERQYAWEDRERGVILLDSVASHANRQEVLLGQDWQKLKLPIMRLQFRDDGQLLQEITSYQASHRVFDALFRDALVRDGSTVQRPFRAPLRAKAPESTPPSPPSAETAGAGTGRAASTQPRSGRSRGRQAAARGKELPAVQVSEEGRMIEESSLEFATPLYQIGPHCLVYGCWDSTGSAGGLGAKFSRAVESRVTGHNARLLQGTRGKLDAAKMPSLPIYHDRTTLSWTVNPDDAFGDENSRVVFPLGEKLSKINHSSVTPDIRDDKTKQLLAGGVTIDHAYQRWALSIPALRALSFPQSKGGAVDEQRDTAARAVLALLALCGLSRLWDKGLWFRSGCTLAFDGEPQIEVVYGRAKEAEKFSITTGQVDSAYELAVAEAEKHGLKMQTEPIDLDPAPNLLEAYRLSRSGVVREEAEAEAGGEG